ncbi:MAG TPA: hypothetical protein VH186_16695 [Chloroflexia bacterium]|nr:hypothetical protein [Chloroflexia bacterium]
MKQAGEPEPPEGKEPSCRILVSNLQGLTLELVTKLIQSQPDLELVETVNDSLELLLKAGENVDLILLGAPQGKPLPGICSHILTEYPQIRIMVLENSGEQAYLYWLGLRQKRLELKSAKTLLKGFTFLRELNPAS